jgi:hypothetical protein
MRTQLNEEKAKKWNKAALCIAEFCEIYSIGRTLVYEEIGAGRLPVRKLGRRTLILVEDAEKWAQALPTLARR